MSGQELVRGKDKVVCTKQRVSVCTKSNEEVYTRHRGRVGEVGCEKNVYRVDEVVCTKQLVGGGRGGEKWRWRVEEEYKKKRVEAELD
ncbi:hypothetical protein PMAC_003399 [Pneumocystis sp. 'macacae']|nr:hypothetical protein PMAC_003399 [Pneumocystis sp. 'macacae']